AIIDPYTLHSNGQQWIAVRTSVPPRSGLNGVDSLGSNLVWGVGGVFANTLTERWDGSAWSIIPSPNRGTYSELKGVTIIASDDVWAVGDYLDSSGTRRTLTLHYSN